jgi:hypothetical protein
MFQKITNNMAVLMRTGTVLVFLFLLLGAVAMAGEPLPESEKNELYSQGKDFFHQATEISASNPETAEALYGKALLRFNRIVEEGGVRNGRLFYNIGNINFLLEDGYFWHILCALLDICRCKDFFTAPLYLLGAYHLFTFYPVVWHLSLY